MPSGMRGTLVSSHFVDRHLDVSLGPEWDRALSHEAWRRFARWYPRAVKRLGPASALRALADQVGVPLAEDLGFTAWAALPSPPGLLVGTVDAPGGVSLPMVVCPWGEPLDRAWRQAVSHSVTLDADWALATNGRQFRVIDARRTYAKAWLEFDLDQVAVDAGLGVVFRALLSADGFAPPAGAAGRDGTEAPRFDRLVRASAGVTLGVCASLRGGMLDALERLVAALASGPRRSAPRRRGADPAPGEPLAGLFDQALTIAYRLLFLLFAEARGLVPVWHPVYRRSYTVEALADSLGRGPAPAGLWEALQAASRLAHSGCRAGDLAVNAFNGRLFSPDHAPLAESAAIDDAEVAGVLTSLTTARVGRGGRLERISFGDLGVEQLGAVYEAVLDYEPARGGDGSVRLVPTGHRRKATGTFYTPRSLTEFLVRTTLAPLVASASSEAILALRVVDPAMGSGAFLTSACRYLATAYESALVAEGSAHRSDVTPADRATFRRLVAERCLFGVDVNPVAVQLARLSLWLATLAADRPLTFLDHHLAAGDSLVGASLDDVLRRPPGTSARARPPARLPLFEPDEFGPALAPVLATRLRLACEPGDSLATVRQKEALLDGLAKETSPYARLKRLADLWCACWFLDPGEAPGQELFGDLSDAVLGRATAMPAPSLAGRLDRAAEVARSRRFFHWTLEFPEVFYGRDGSARSDAGFDAVLSNPPWDMIRADRRAGPDRAAARLEAERLIRFIRGSGIYRHSGSGQPNRFQLFVERAARLARPGGRIGLVVPAGLLADQGSASLRRLLFERCATEVVVGLGNRRGIFPIHRSVRFAAICSEVGRPTIRCRARFGVEDPAVLDEVPDEATGALAGRLPLELTPALLRRLSGEGLEVPWLASTADLALVESVTARWPAFGSSDGWQARFGRELNVSDDRGAFATRPAGLPVLEGKHVEPFRCRTEAARFRIAPGEAARLLDGAATFERPRLVVREVASATNRLTLIAAIAPAGAVTAHTLLCLKTAVSAEARSFLCGVLNSYVANHLARLRVGTHVSAAVLEHLPVPWLPPRSAELGRVAAIAAQLGGIAAVGAIEGPATLASAGGRAAEAELQAEIARLYGVTAAQLAHLLGTFPRIPGADRQAVMEAFARLR